MPNHHDINHEQYEVHQKSPVEQELVPFWVDLSVVSLGQGTGQAEDKIGYLEGVDGHDCVITRQKIILTIP